MHRSGTSALAGVLSEAGVYFGKSIVAAAHDNTKGFFENYKIQDLNDAILSHIGKTWDSVDLLPDKWWTGDAMRGFLPQAKRIIKKEYGNHTLFCIKDPRFSFLLPFWEEVLDTSNIKTVAIVAMRKPIEIASSLAKRNHFAEVRSYLITSAHLLSAERYTRHVSRLAVRYDDLLNDPYRVLTEISSTLDLPIVLDANVKDRILTFIEPGMQSNRAEHTAIDKSRAYVEHVNSIYTHTIQCINEGSRLACRVIEDAWVLQEKMVDSHAEQLLTQNHYAKLVCDFGQGYSNRKFWMEEIRLGVITLTFTFDTERKSRVTQLKLFPADVPCSIRLLRIHVWQGTTNIKYRLSDNSFARDGMIFHFDNAHPQWILDIEEPLPLSSMSVEMEYLSLGTMLLDRPGNQTMPRRDEKSKRSLPFLSIFKYPVRLLSNVNMRNYRILRSALRRESPRQIWRNFIKLLKRPDVQREIQSMSVEGQSTYFKNNRKVKKDHDFAAQDAKDLLARITKSKQAISKLKILYLAPRLPEYDTSSGERRATRLLELLAQDCEVYVCGLLETRERYAQYIKDLGIGVVDTKNVSRIDKIHAHFDVIIYAWYYTIYDAQRIRRMYPDALHIIDSVDIQWVREERSLGVENSINERQVQHNKKNEMAAYAQADKIWLVSEADRDALLHELPSAQTAIVSNIHEAEIEIYNDPETNDILFIGGYNHLPNIGAVKTLALEILPQVSAQIPDARLVIVGSHAPKEIADLGQQKGVMYLGYVAEDQLADLYNQTLLSVSPLTSGSGIKGKVCEAVSYRVPVLTNAIGNEGIGLVHGESGLLAESNSAMIDEIINAMQRTYDFDKITQKAQELLANIVGQDIVKRNMMASLYHPVDICIVTYNRIDLLKNCINSIIKYTSIPDYQIIVYSNGCTDGTQQYLRQLSQAKSNIKIILSDSNDVFVKPNNKMMRMHPDRDIVLLNNDTMVTNGWLIGLHHAVYKLKKIGIAGAKILYPD